MRSGEAVAITGVNGSGKTTLLRLCAGLLRPDAGTVTCLAVTAERDRRRVTGWAPAAHPATEATLLGHLSWHGALRGLTASDATRRSAELLDAVGLGDRARDEVRSLSSGLRARVGVAVALLHRPGVVLLDEPTASCDQDGVDVICALLAEHLAGGGAAVVATHSPEHLAPLAADRLRLGTA